MRLRWVHALRMKEMAAAALNMEAFRRQHGEQVNVPEAQHLDSLTKLAVLASQTPGMTNVAPEVSFDISDKAVTSRMYTATYHCCPSTL